MIPETLDVVFEENNGALVLVAGSLNIQDTLKDEFYGISMAAVKMRKVVQVSAVVRYPGYMQPCAGVPVV